MTKIKNINEYYGDPVEFVARDEDQYRIQMALAIIASGVTMHQDVDILAEYLTEGVDYEIVS